MAQLRKRKTINRISEERKREGEKVNSVYGSFSGISQTTCKINEMRKNLYQSRWVCVVVVVWSEGVNIAEIIFFIRRGRTEWQILQHTLETSYRCCEFFSNQNIINFAWHFIVYHIAWRWNNNVYELFSPLFSLRWNCVAKRNKNQSVVESIVESKQ